MLHYFKKLIFCGEGVNIICTYCIYYMYVYICVSEYRKRDLMAQNNSFFELLIL